MKQLWRTKIVQGLSGPRIRALEGRFFPCERSSSSRKRSPLSFLNVCALWPVTSPPYVTLSGLLSQVEDTDFRAARYPRILSLGAALAKGLWHQARAFLAAGLTPHRPLIHLTQQEALKLPFQCPSPACCGLCAFLYHPWQELCSTSWRGLPLERGHLASGTFLLPAGNLFSLVPWSSPGVTLPVHCLGVSGHVQPWLNCTKVPHRSGGVNRRLQRWWAGCSGLGKCGRQERPLALYHLSL